MKIRPIADVKTHFSGYVDECGEEPVIVTRNGRPAAVLIGVTDEAELDRLVLAYTPRFRSLLDASEHSIRKGSGIRHAEFWKAKRRP